MYWLISQINPYTDQIGEYPKKETFSKEYEDLFNLQAKKLSDEERLNDDKENEGSLFPRSETFKSSLELAKKGIMFSHESSNTIGLHFEEKSHEPRDLFYRKVVKICDILCVILNLVVVALTFVENEMFYSKNKPYILCWKLLVETVHSAPRNHTWNGVLLESYNLTSLLFGQTKKDFLPYYSRNSSLVEHNKLILSHYEITPDTFNYSEEVDDWENIKMSLILTEKIENIRYMIIVFSLLSIATNFVINYMQYKIEDFVSCNVRTLTFYKTKYFYVFILKTVFLSILPYPKLSTYSVYFEADVVHLTLYTNILSCIVYFRFMIMLKLLKYSKWNNKKIVQKCNEHGINHSMIFVTKCLTKENPFFLSVFFFVIFIVPFYATLRINEIYFWLGVSETELRWESYYNTFFYLVFIMLLIPFVEIYAKTIIGRIISILMCVFGLYIISKVMSCLYSISVLNAKENKIHGLSRRFELRNKLKNVNSNIIYNSLLCVIKKKKTYRNRIFTQIKIKAQVNNYISYYEFIPIVENLFDLVEKVQSGINQIENEINQFESSNLVLKEVLLNQSHIINSQKETIKNLVSFYNLIEENGNLFKKLSEFDRSVLRKEFGRNYTKNEDITNYFKHIEKNDVLFDSIRHDSKVYKDNGGVVKCQKSLNEGESTLHGYSVLQTEISNHFDLVFFKKKTKRRLNSDSIYPYLNLKIHKEIDEFPDERLVRSFEV